MKSTSHRWNVVTPSVYPWEQEALEYVREQLPDHEPYRAWANFSLTSDDASIREIDLLVLTPQGLFLVELKGHRGSVTGNGGYWSFRFEGRSKSVENPRLLTDNKAKKLKARLARTKAFRKAKGVRLPFVEALVFLSSTDLNTSGLDAMGRQGVLVRQSEDGVSTPIPGLRPLYPWSSRSGPKIGSATARTLDRAMREIGVQRLQDARKVGSYELVEALGEGPGWQDWLARHGVLKSRRRLRLYHTTSGARTETRRTLLRAAKREVLMLQGVEHEGIVRPVDYIDSDLGPAVLFDHPADAEPLDRWLFSHESRLDFPQRLQLFRQLAEVMAYAHGRQLVHRSLHPACVLVLDPESAEPRLAIMSWQTGSRRAGSQGTTASGLSPTEHPERLVADQSVVYLAPEVIHGGKELDGIRADIFSLGAIAYRIFSGEAPASSLTERAQRLLKHPGFLVSDVVDGVSNTLADLIEESTPSLTRKPGCLSRRCARSVRLDAG
ncbi:MAG: NERD domain-containing protein, partial [Acidobacteriota bacterium]